MENGLDRHEDFHRFRTARGGFGRMERGLAKDLSPVEAFEELKKLCGEWNGTTAEGGAEKGRLMVADTVLLKAWV